MVSYYYKVFGIVFSSDLFIPEWNTTDENNVDVSIKIVDNLPTIKKPLHKRSYIQFNQNEYWINISGIVEFMVLNGNEILIKPEEEIDETLIRRYFLSRIMSVLMFQRNTIPVCGSFIHINGINVLLTGDSNYPKSILPNWYKAQGNDIISSFLTPIFNDGTIKMGYDYVNELPFKSDQNIAHSIDVVIDIITDKSDKFKYSFIKEPEKFYVLMRNMLHKDVLLSLDGQQFVKHTMSVVKSADYMRLILPSTNFSFDEMIDQIHQITENVKNSTYQNNMFTMLNL